MINSELPAPEPEPARRVWTAPRVAFAALVLALAAVVFTPGCGPSDSSANVPAGGGGTTAGAPNATPAAQRPANPGPTPLPGEVFNAEMKTLEGDRFKLAEQSGQVMVLNLWATWCGPCRAEIPEFVQINSDYEARGVRFVGVTMEDDRGNTPEAVSKFARDYKINYRIVWADEEIFSALISPSYGIPQTYVLGRDGRVVKKFRGFSPQIGTQLRAALDEALAG